MNANKQAFYRYQAGARRRRRRQMAWRRIVVTALKSGWTSIWRRYYNLTNRTISTYRVNALSRAARRVFSCNMAYVTPGSRCGATSLLAGRAFDLEAKRPCRLPHATAGAVRHYCRLSVHAAPGAQHLLSLRRRGALSGGNAPYHSFALFGIIEYNAALHLININNEK